MTESCFQEEGSELLKKTLINDQSTDKSLKMMLSTKKQLKNVMPRAEPVSVNPCNRWTMEDEDESLRVIFGFIKYQYNRHHPI